MSDQYTSLQNALLSVELAQRDLAHAWRAWEGGEWREFVMRVKWAHGQLQSAIARLENEKEPERK